MSKIYLLMEATGSDEDYRDVPLMCFTSKEEADKVCIGFETAFDIIYDNSPIGSFYNKYGYHYNIKGIEKNEWIKQQNYILMNTNRPYWSKFYEQGIYESELPTYSVQEIDLIN